VASLRPTLAIAVAVTTVAVGGVVRSAAHDTPPTSAEVAAPLSLAQDLPVRILPRTTTTTTTAPPPPATTVPPPPPPPAPRAAPAPRPAARIVAPAPPPPPPAPTITPSPEGETRMLELINAERAGEGLPALRLNGAAASVARSWSTRMAGSGMSHNPNLAADLRAAGATSWTTCGENVGYGGSVDQVHSVSMGSGVHRANILNPQFSEVGVGAVVADGRVWVTVDFIG
jgi:uncharacterized protein YkwD